MTKVNTSYWPSLPRISLPTGRFAVLAMGAVIAGVAVVTIWKMMQKAKASTGAATLDAERFSSPNVDFPTKVKNAMLSGSPAAEKYPGYLREEAIERTSCDAMGVSLIGKKSAKYLFLSGVNKKRVLPLDGEVSTMLPISGSTTTWASREKNHIYGMVGFGLLEVPGQIVQVADGAKHIYVGTRDIGSQLGPYKVLIYPKSEEAGKGPSRELRLEDYPHCFSEQGKDLVVVMANGKFCTFPNVHSGHGEPTVDTLSDNHLKYAKVVGAKDGSLSFFYIILAGSFCYKTSTHLNNFGPGTGSVERFPVLLNDYLFFKGEKGVQVFQRSPEGESYQERGELRCSHPILGLAAFEGQLFAFGPNSYTQWF